MSVYASCDGKWSRKRMGESCVVTMIGVGHPDGPQLLWRVHQYRGTRSDPSASNRVGHGAQVTSKALESLAVGHMTDELLELGHSATCELRRLYSCHPHEW